MKVCADETTAASDCAGCELIGEAKVSAWKAWDCNQEQGSVVYISNHATDLGNDANYIVACEAQVTGFPA